MLCLRMSLDSHITPSTGQYSIQCMIQHNLVSSTYASDNAILRHKQTAHQRQVVLLDRRDTAQINKQYSQRMRMSAEHSDNGCLSIWTALVLVHRTTSQLCKGMAGALGLRNCASNCEICLAIEVVMRLLVGCTVLCIDDSSRASLNSQS